eukprot:c16739_g1_i1.p2 GENE.c16739_g1_i1~~c16739_g1_i1.p2  ORF type:complete len:217 (+),score=28.79 c16739_g1_i1:78-728(+)
MEELPSYDEVVNGTKATGPAPGWEPSEPRTLNSVATVDVVDEPGANPIISNQYLYEDSGIAPQQHEPMCEDLAERAGPCGLLLFLLVCEFLVVLAAGLLKSSTWGVVIALVYFLAVVPVAFAIVTVKPELCRCFCSSYRIDKMCSMAFLMLVYFYMFIVPVRMPELPGRGCEPRQTLVRVAHSHAQRQAGGRLQRRSADPLGAVQGAVPQRRAEQH